jgi:hypothetical protein
MVERTPLSPQDVVITRTVARFGNTSYQIAAISSVSVQHQETVNRTFLSTGLLLIIPVLVIVILSGQVGSKSELLEA